MFEFLRARKHIVRQLLAHISHSSVTELVLKLISLEDVPDTRGIVNWLREEDLMLLLVDQLAPSCSTEVFIPYSSYLILSPPSSRIILLRRFIFLG